MTTNNRPTILEEAADITSRDRNESYGEPLDNHTDCGAMWSVYLSRATGVKVTITPRMVCWMMVLLKSCRDAHMPHRDSLVDGCGWLRNAEMCERETARREDV